jgi:hypothetical protein
MLAFRRQPLKGLYLTYQLIATLLVRVPIWVLLSIPRYVFLLTHFLPNLKSYQIMASQNDMDNKANDISQAHSTAYKDDGSV